MQTFLPRPSFEETARILDWRRLGKQRVEATQILSALTDPTYGWQNHSAVRMWRGFPEALTLYRNTIIEEWVRRGYRNNMPILKVNRKPEMPPWLGHARFHLSHRSNLLRKAPAHYTQFGWRIKNDHPYLWPYLEEGVLRFQRGKPPTEFV